MPRRLRFTAMDQSKVVAAYQDDHASASTSAGAGRQSLGNGGGGEGGCDCGERVSRPDVSAEERGRAGDGGEEYTERSAEEGIAGPEDRAALGSRHEGVRDSGAGADGVAGVGESGEETCRFEQIVDGHHCYGMSKGFQALSEPGLVCVCVCMCVYVCVCVCVCVCVIVYQSVLIALCVHPCRSLFVCLWLSLRQCVLVRAHTHAMPALARVCMHACLPDACVPSRTHPRDRRR